MAQNIRLNDILDLARRQGKVSTDSLARAFGVTVQTARRDLNALCDKGHLVRVYGGAILPSGTHNIGHDDRKVLQSEGKERMAAEVARRIPDGASVFLDIGTTLEAVARRLAEHRNLMVVTNNLHAGNALDYDFREVRVAQTVMELARRSWLMADHSKFARSAPVRIGRITDFDAFVTDAPAPSAVTAACTEGACEIVIAA